MKRQIIITEEKEQFYMQTKGGFSYGEACDILAGICAEIIIATANKINMPVDQVTEAMILSIKSNVENREKQ